ncbi:MAG: hypothetical protein DYH13_07655 [Alphaproteobacteria bacterium PRO2]|nr:hypothetical protein [Alphaproteobacteria bacterium PRO2]
MTQEKNSSPEQAEDPGLHLPVRIRRRFLDFITPSMISTVSLLAFLLILLRERIGESYHENIPLNTAIFIVIGFAIFKAFKNNYDLYRSIGFLEEIEKLEDSHEVTPQAVQKLADRLSGDASLFNIQNMYRALENLSVFGHLNFSDNDSRLIKSKFGSRVKHERDVVSYFAGLLIMMGLIGTFWGLLETITAVGGALNQVAGGFAADGGAATEAATAAAQASNPGDDLGKFIGSIAAPLQGMGIAFSASLFGIGGSLILGFLNFFSTHAQNHVIEGVSRWIDNRIPQMNPALANKVSGMAVPKSDDLKTWLAGFVYLSSQTNQKIGKIIMAMSRSSQAIIKNAQQIEKINNYQKDMYVAMENMGAGVSHVKDSMKVLAGNVEPSMRLNASIHGSLEQIRDIISRDAALSHGNSDQQARQMATLGEQLQEFNVTLQSMNRVQDRLVAEMEKVSGRPQQENGAAELSNLIWQLNTLMEEIKQKNVAAYMNIFDAHGNGSSKTGQNSD